MSTNSNTGYELCTHSEGQLSAFAGVWTILGARLAAEASGRSCWGASGGLAEKPNKKRHTKTSHENTVTGRVISASVLNLRHNSRGR
jgi:hypothetical protein